MLFVARYPGFIMGAGAFPSHNGLQVGVGGGVGNMLKIVKNIGKSRVGKFQYYFRFSNLIFS